MLHLHEEVLLLALDDDKGTVPGGASMWRNAAGGALLAELMLAGRIRATDEKKPKIEVIDPTPLGDPVLDATLKERKDHMKKLCDGELTCAMTRQAVAATQAAILVAAIVPTIITTAAVT